MKTFHKLSFVNLNLYTLHKKTTSARMQTMSGQFEPAVVIELGQKNPGDNDCTPEEMGYDKAIDNSDDEVLIVCSVICDENDEDVEVSVDNKVTTYSHEVEGEQITLYSDLDQYAMLMKNDQINLECASSPVFSGKTENSSSFCICQICNRHLRHRTSMKYHVLKHTGRKPHTCFICDRKYTLNSYLKLHMKKHVSENLPCPFCDEEFQSELDLRNHLHTHLVDNMLNIDQADGVNKHNIDNITETNTPDERSGFCKPGHESHGILRASSDDNAEEEIGLSNDGYSVDSGPGGDPIFMDTSEQILHKDNLPNMKTTEKMEYEEHYKGSKDEAVNLLNELKADIDQELFDLQEVDDQETDECVQFLMSKVSSDFKQLIQKQNQDKVNHKDNLLHKQDAKSNIGIDSDDNIDVEVDDEKFESGVDHLSIKSEPRSEKRSDDFKQIKQIHFKTSFACDVCARTFIDLDTLKRHQEKHAKRKFRCDHCNMDFGTIVINSHMIKHFELLYCTICLMLFQEVEKFKEHIEWHRGNTKSSGSGSNFTTDPLQCYICRTVYSSQLKLRKHFKRVHSRTNKVPCPVCSKWFDRKALITEHMNVHRNKLVIPKSYASAFDGTNQKNIKDEMISPFDENDSPKLNVKDFKTRIRKDKKGVVKIKGEREDAGKLKREIKDNKDLGNSSVMHCYKLQCRICFKTWWLKSDLIRHIKGIHLKRRDVCAENFDINEYIELVTVSVEPLVCDHCNKKCRSRKALQEHIVSHYPKHSFKCKICSNVFHKRWYLKEHMYTHEKKNRTLKCKVCDKFFLTVETLYKHCKLSHPNDPDIRKNPTKCRLCGIWCMSTLTLTGHLQSIHGLIKDENKDIQL